MTPLILAAARWLLTSPQGWMLLASAFPHLKDLWEKFQAGTATQDDAVRAIKTIGYDAVKSYMDSDTTTPVTAAHRMRFEDSVQDQGEIGVDQLRAGDTVKFLAELDKPDTARVDAGTLGKIVSVDANNGFVDVATLGSTTAANGDIHMGESTVTVAASDLTLIANDQDPRLSQYRIGSIVYTALADADLPGIDLNNEEHVKQAMRVLGHTALVDLADEVGLDAVLDIAL